MKTINIGLVGFGTVGTGVVKLLKGQAPLLERRLAARLRLKRIADLDLTRPRDVEVDPKILTTNAREIIEDPAIDIVIELIGGTTTAREVSLAALRSGKHLVTANKALLATHGLELFRAAAEKRVDLGFEASVCGGIPIIRAVREGLVANRIHSIEGIVNGTCNYILTKMTELGAPFAEVLKEAQDQGYAEVNPSLDIDGIDAAHKLQILASIAYGGSVDFNAIHVEGIRGIDPDDIQYAKELGYRVKLLAIAKETDGEIEVRVHPTLIPEDHLLAFVGGVFNAVYIVGDATGSLMFYGRGAGQLPTASAVVSDVVEIAQNILYQRPSRPSHIPAIAGEGLKIRPMAEVRTRYYLRVMAVDKPGVLSKVSGILGSHDISIASVIQKGRHARASVPVVMMTHEAVEGAMRRALAEIDALDVVSGRTVCLRVEES
ncbi:MAG: hom, homoserine dehydrogenase [candidate division NC10 bacterium CSP1-5]|nr:MAG: hom, homoserine dehydrogenase [candidate division NC10 bacterium CSP1-5]